ncbi:MAG TPA: nucleotidyltransferase family protein [Actinomycetota bacterium]|nr:nucleotidyltransferase family protein [Actinomycetota bacterium]
MPPGAIVGILLAAGSATRFGGDKLLAPLPDGYPVGVVAFKNLAAAVDAVIAVVRPGDERLATALAACGARLTACARASEGMGTSLAWGVRAAPVASGWLVALADMPWIRPASAARVVGALRSGAGIAAPSWRDSRGHPVGFASSFYPDLITLSGDEGAKTILARNPITLVETDDDGVVRDVDRREDLSR